MFQGSKYFEDLDEVAKDRYKDKLKIDGLFIADPYIIEKSQWCDDPHQWPVIEYPDLFNYLTSPKCSFSSGDLKNYKSLKAYEYVLAGKVETVQSYLPPNHEDLVVLRAAIQPSQRSDVPHRAWVLAKKDGIILSAHCTCLAGLGEACSHVAAVLFKVECATRLGMISVAPTDVSCKWNNSFSRKTEPSEIEKIDFTAARWKQKSKNSKKAKKNSHVINQEAPTLSAKHMKDLFEALPNAVVFTCISSLKVSEQPAEKKYTNLPPSLIDILKTIQSQGVQKIEPQHFTPFFNDDNVKQLEKMTHNQISCHIWNSHRLGRLTASNFGLAIKKKKWSRGARETLTNLSSSFTRAETQWGIEKEKDALKAYEDYGMNVHSNFKVESAGLFVNPNYPYLGASPDALVYCDCCGFGVVEIKCPYKHKNETIHEILNTDKQFCLNNSGDLKQGHKYFYQILGEMALSKRTFGDFVIWTEKDIHVSRVYLDQHLWEEVLEKLEKIYFENLIPFLQAFTPF